MDKKLACKIVRPDGHWGTGYLISPQKVITAYHVVKDMEWVSIEFVGREIGKFRLTLDADTLCWKDERLDVALLRCVDISPDQVPPHPRQVCLPDCPTAVFFQAFPRFAVEDLNLHTGEQCWGATIEKFDANDECADVKYEKGPLDRSRWDGASGALLFENKASPQRPVAVLTHRQDREMAPAQLWATPLYALLHGERRGESFRQALGWDELRQGALRQRLERALRDLQSVPETKGYNLLRNRLEPQDDSGAEGIAAELLFRRNLEDVHECLQDVFSTARMKSQSLSEADSRHLFEIFDLLLPLRFIDTRPQVAECVQAGSAVMVRVAGGRPLAEIIMAGAEGVRAQWVPLNLKTVRNIDEFPEEGPMDFAGVGAMQSWAPPPVGDSDAANSGSVARVDQQACGILAAIMAIRGELYTGDMRGLVVDLQVSRRTAENLVRLCRGVRTVCKQASIERGGRLMYLVVRPRSGDSRCLEPYRRVQELIPELPVVELLPAGEGDQLDLDYGELVYARLVKTHGM